MGQGVPHAPAALAASARAIFSAALRHMLDKPVRLQHSSGPVGAPHLEASNAGAVSRAADEAHDSMAETSLPLSPESLAFVETLYASWQADSASVSADWQAWFAAIDAATPGPRNGSVQLGPSFASPSLFHAPLATNRAAHAEPTGRAASNFVLPSPRDPAKVAQRVPLLERLQLFTRLPAAELTLVADIADDVHVAAGTTLFRAGDPGDGLYIVVSGQMRVARGGVEIAVIGPSEVVGELAIMDQQPRSADAIAVVDSHLLRLHSDALDDLLDRHGVLARNLFHVVTRRLRESNARQERVDQLVRAFRVRGHAIAELDPLGRGRKHHPELEIGYYGLSDADLDQPFSSRTMPGAPVMSLRRITQRLHNTYCRHIGVQYMHIDDLQVQSWLQARMEDTENRRVLSAHEQRRILRKLTEAELFETFIHKKYLGAKRFSLEGAESLLPLLDLAIEAAASQGVDHVVIGMAHRGRLNVLSNILGKKPSQIFEEFEDKDPHAFIGRGDVKYHAGFDSIRVTDAGTPIHLSLAFNPSHLEFVGPVVQGRVRGKQERQQDRSRDRVLGLVIHGDAAFAGQGVVQESLNMSQLPGYETGGTIHVIVNNQVGFTTPPESSRSSAYATDVAKMLEIPVFHVNGEHPDAVAQTIQVAMEFRRRFKRDVVIDMYCFRRHGHNEGDEPRFTQPVMYQWVDRQPSVRESYVKNLIELGDIDAATADRIADECRERLEAGLNAARGGEADESNKAARAAQLELDAIWSRYHGGYWRLAEEVKTGVPTDRLSALLRATTQVPEGFVINRKLERIVAQRVEMADGSKPLDWSAGEALAFATLVTEGTPVRLSGQDAGRGTFAHRHSVWHDQRDGSPYVPLDHLQPDQARFAVFDSPLSETGVLAFDYGFSLEWPDSLVIWEAQFGDFANGAQVIIDQFISSSEDKWSRLSGLVLMLPHGFEGQGPEHSSARLERFLTLAAEDNIQVMNLSTPAQLFHALRRQQHRALRKPLVIMTPKSLLRHPAAISTLRDLSDGAFQPILDDAVVEPEKVRRVLLCSGKVYYELAAEREARGAWDHAIVRIEQLYPVADDELQAALDRYPNATEARWVQEEPVNMGAWVFLRFRLGGKLGGRLAFTRVTRPESASPATGSKASHEIEQRHVVEGAFGDNPIACVH